MRPLVHLLRENMKNLTHACQNEQFTTNDPENTKER